MRIKAIIVRLALVATLANCLAAAAEPHPRKPNIVLSGGPTDHGFDSYFGVDLPNMPPYAWIEGNRLTAIPTESKPEEMFGTDGPMVPGWKLDAILPELARLSAAWIAGQGRKRSPSSSTCREVICLNDFMATVAEILEFPLPDNAAEDSTSILPLLTGDETFLPRRPMVVNHDCNGNFAIRDGKWKLVGAKLFNLETDLKETTDVAAQDPEIAARMAKNLETYQQSGRSRALRTPNHGRPLDR